MNVDIKKTVFSIYELKYILQFKYPNNITYIETHNTYQANLFSESPSNCL